MSASRRVLLTGGSSFTGVWFAEALAQAGFEVIAPLLRRRDAYTGVRLARVERLERFARVAFERPFGSAPFLDLIAAEGRIDILAHHAAQITNYRAADFDPIDALARNTAGAPQVVEALRRAGGCALVLTGTVFEAGEGGGEAPQAVTPYGLSKTLTRTAMEYWVQNGGLRFARFVIPSPYGVLEEPRFSWYLFRSWFAGETPLVRTPLYVRDHIPIQRLAAAYVECLSAAVDAEQSVIVARPSGWIAPQGDFARRVAREAGARLGIACPLAFAEQTTTEEPLRRVNAEPVPGVEDPAGDPAFWDSYVAWYGALQARGALA